MAITQQDDGKIIAVGRTKPDDESGKLYVIRLLDDGVFDTSFGDDGVVFLDVDDIGSEEGDAVVFQPNNTITVGGFFKQLMTTMISYLLNSSQNLM